MASSTGSKSESNSPVPTGSAPSGTPSPLIIGKSFIKQYYQVLSTNPEQITKFYKPDSVLSHSLKPSVPTIPKTLASSADQIFQWAKSSNEDGDEEPKLCFDFGSGAIDAQESVNGGILLVVTGHITLPNQSAKTFVHTFFLNNGAAPGKKRQFYVHNDILRFLEEGSNEETIPTVAATATATATTEHEHAVTAATGTNESKEPSADASVTIASEPQDASAAQSPDAVVVQEVNDTQGTPDDSSPSVLPHVPPPVAKTEANETDGSKDKVDGEAADSLPVTDSMEGDAAPPQAKDEKKPKKSRSRGRSRKSRSSSPTDADKKGKTKAKEPGSWASLVAGSKPSAVAAAAAEVAAKLSEVSITSSSQEQKKKTPDQKESVTKIAPSEPSKEKSSTSTQRTPEATILIKNLPEKSKESEIRAMFKPYADKLNKKILGITLLASRGFAFVDFDSKVVVEAVVKDAMNEKKGQEKFILNGKVLDVGRKVPQESNKSGSNRSKSPGAQKNKGGRRHSPRGGNRSKK
jgi:hypothetical protein